MDELRSVDPQEAAEIAAVCAPLSYPATVGQLTLRSRGQCEDMFARAELDAGTIHARDQCTRCQSETEN